MTSNPISILPACNLNAIIISIWMFKMKSMLLVRDLWDFVENEQVAPVDPKELEKYRINEALAMIGMSGADYSIPKIQDRESAHIACKILQKKYEKPTKTRVLQLKILLHNLKMTNDQDVIEHLIKLKYVKNQNPAMGEKLQSSDVIEIALNNLPSAYEFSITSLEVVDKIRNVNF